MRSGMRGISSQLGSWAVGQLGSWTVGQLGSWTVGQLDSWTVGKNVISLVLFNDNKLLGLNHT